MSRNFGEKWPHLSPAPFGSFLLCFYIMPHCVFPGKNQVAFSSTRSSPSLFNYCEKVAKNSPSSLNHKTERNVSHNHDYRTLATRFPNFFRVFHRLPRYTALRVSRAFPLNAYPPFPASIGCNMFQFWWVQRLLLLLFLLLSIIMISSLTEHLSLLTRLTGQYT